MPLNEALPMLQGVRIVDLTSVVFGPYSTQILADLGAEVTKIESTGRGDVFRYSSRPAHSKAMSPGHMSLNRGKRSAVLDLKQSDDIETMKRLIADADVFIHNVRANAITRLGFDYESVKALKDDIIYVHCVGFGSGGPYSDLQAYDDIIQGATGTVSLAGRVDGKNRPRFIPSLIADKVAGLNGAQATLAAIIHKLRTGQGQHVEVPMFESFAHFMLKEHLAGLTFKPPVGGACYRRQVTPDRQPFPTADGWIVIVPYTLESWDNLFEKLGAPEVMQDERFKSLRERMKNEHELYNYVAENTPKKKTAEWIEILRAERIPCMPVREIDDILGDPHLNETGFFKLRTHTTEGEFYEMADPVSYEKWTPGDYGPAPLLGEHTDEVKQAYSD